MKTGKIKAEWASLSLAVDEKVIVCARFNGTSSCIHFGSLERLKQAIDSRRISVRKWAVTVPRSSCILKSVTLPASDMAEAAKMLEFEVPSLVPLSPDEFVYGCTLMDQTPSMLKVLVCILKLSTLKECLKPYGDMGIRPHMIVLDSLAIQNWFEKTGNVTSTSVINVLVNKKRSYVQTSINGNLYMTNDLIMTDVNIIASSDEIVDEMFHQVESMPASLKDTITVTIAGAEEFVSQVKNLILSDVRAWGLAERISVVHNPKIICCDSGDGIEPDIFSFEAVITSGLLGLVEDKKYACANLLPQDDIKRQERKILLLNYLRVACLSLLLLLFLWLSLAASNLRIERKSHLIQALIAPIELVAGGVDSKRQRVIAIRKQLSNRGRISRIIDELYRYTPKTISISELNFTTKPDGVSIEVKGQADSMPAAFDLTDAMGKASLLSGIQVENVQQTPGPGGSVVTFKAYCDIQEDYFDNGRDKK